MGTIVFLLILAGIAYLSIVRKLRYQRRNATLEKYRHYSHDSESLGQMTLGDAFEIQQSLAELEFPITFSVSIFFALFKVPHFILLMPLSTQPNLQTRPTASHQYPNS